MRGTEDRQGYEVKFKEVKKLEVGGGGDGAGKESLPLQLICLYPCMSPVLLPLGMQANN